MDFEKTNLITLIIPTRNRPSEMSNLIAALSLQTISLVNMEVIVVDSSDQRVPLDEKKLGKVQSLRHIETKIQSSAVQRNIGLDLVSKESKLIFFLDDDVLPPRDYFEKVLSFFSDESVVGVSGVAINVSKSNEINQKKSIYFYKKMFTLDSNKQGSILRSGISIPVKFGSGLAIETSWLIGCAAWRHSAIGQKRFERDFLGYSLGEDVLFSIKMSKEGKLITIPNLVVDHRESSLNRPPQTHFWKYWMIYRWRVCGLQDSNCFTKNFFYWWETLGQLLILTILRLLKPAFYRGAILGVLLGVLNLAGLKK